MEHKEKARMLFAQGYNCAQATFGAYHADVGMTLQQAVRFASPFGGGMGRLREVCGAVSGIYMVLGCLLGYDDPSDTSLKAELYKRVQTLAQRFKERHGGTFICRELLASLSPDCSPIPTPRTEAFYQTRPCAAFIEDACDILDDFLKQESKAEATACAAEAAAGKEAPPHKQ